MPLAIAWTQSADARLLHLRALGQPWHTVASALRVRPQRGNRAGTPARPTAHHAHAAATARPGRAHRPARLAPWASAVLAGHHRRDVPGGRGLSLSGVPMTGIPPARLDRAPTIPTAFDIRRTRANRPPLKTLPAHDGCRGGHRPAGGRRAHAAEPAPERRTPPSRRSGGAGAFDRRRGSPNPSCPCGPDSREWTRRWHGYRSYRPKNWYYGASSAAAAW